MFSERVPKNTYCGVNKMELAVYDSVAVFNYGRLASLDIYKMVMSNLDSIQLHVIQ